MNSTSQAKTYEEMRAELIRQIDDAETKMIELYRAHLRELLTDADADIVCTDIDTDEIETIRTRRYGNGYDGEDFKATHTLHFKVGKYEITFELVYANWSEDCGSCRFHGGTKITFCDSDTTLSFDNGSEWFMAPDKRDDRKEERQEFFKELPETFGDWTSVVAACANLIIKHADKMKW